LQSRKAWEESHSVRGNIWVGHERLLSWGVGLEIHSKRQREDGVMIWEETEMSPEGLGRLRRMK
jgi:hypothetical protein